MIKEISGICEMCGHYVKNRQEAHIVAEIKTAEINYFMLCPSCHLMFDDYLKPKLFKALTEFGSKDLPKSWKTSIYEQGRIASMSARNKKNS